MQDADLNQDGKAVVLHAITSGAVLATKPGCGRGGADPCGRALSRFLESQESSDLCHLMED